MFEFFKALFEIILFFGIIFYVVFILFTGGHALVSKKPLEENLNPKTVRNRLKQTIILTALILLGEFLASRVKKWWKDDED